MICSRSDWIRPIALLAALCVVIAGCGGGQGSNSGSGGGRQFLSMGTAPAGGGQFFPLGTAMAEVMNEHGGGQWKITAKATKGTQENLRRLERDELQLALANAAITFHAVRGIEGFEKEFPVQAVVTLAPNVGHFVTLQSSNIKSLADLKGKRVAVGPAGAGFEYFLRPLLEAHGVTYDDFTALNATQSAMVDMLGDGSADAIFLGGAIGLPALTQACSSFDIAFIPYDPDARQKLIDEYTFFSGITVPANTYSDLPEDFDGLNVGSIHLIVASSADEQLVYDLTKTIWENREEIAAKHSAAKSINEGNAARKTGTDFHPGALRFYEEIGIIDAPASADAAVESDSSAESADGGDTPAESAQPATDAAAEPADGEPGGDE